MMAVGLRAANLPTEIEADFLVAFLARNFAGHTVQELALAFELAISRQLDLRTEDVICYENFSVEYVSRILAAYRAWAAKQMAAVQAVEERQRQVTERERQRAALRRQQQDRDHIGFLVTRLEQELGRPKPDMTAALGLLGQLDTYINLYNASYDEQVPEDIRRYAANERRRVSAVLAGPPEGEG